MRSRLVAQLASIATGILISGCVTFEVGANASITPQSVNDSQIVHSSMYGFRWQQYHVQKCDESALARVEINYNWLELMAAAATLGLYAPLTVEWWCDDPSSGDDEEEEGLDPGDEFRSRGAG